MVSAMQAARADVSDVRLRGDASHKPILTAALTLYVSVVSKREHALFSTPLCGPLPLLSYQPLCLPHNWRGSKSFFHNMLLLFSMNFVRPGRGTGSQSAPDVLQTSPF
jgi:hypothetical protein